MTRKISLITGASGFVGRHLKNELESNGYEVVGTSRIPREEFVKMDVTNYEEVRSVILKDTMSEQLRYWREKLEDRG